MKKIIAPKIFWQQNEIAKDLLAIFLFWILAIVVVNPIGNFPLNDDWSWGLAVKKLIQTGKFQPTGWTQMTLLTHVLWGALFCFPFGFSFTTLRISALTISIFGVMALYLYLSKSDYPRKVRWAACMTLVANPLYFSQSYTFMTDMPFTVFAIISLAFFLENLQSGSTVCLIGGTIIACMAILSRQIGLFIVLAFFPAFLLRFGASLKNFARAVMPFLCGATALAVFQFWMKKNTGLPVWYNVNFKFLLFFLRYPKHLIHLVYHNTFVILMYSGIILFPLLVILSSEFIKRIPKKRITVYFLIFISFTCWISYKTVFGGHVMPFSGNVLVSGGIGPLTLHDSYFLSPNAFGGLPKTFWWFVTVMAIGGAGLLLIFILEVIVRFFSGVPTISEQDQKSKQVFLALCCLGYYLPISFGIFFDRYMLPLIVLLSLLIVLSVVKGKFPVNSFSSFAGFGIILIFFLYSLLATHDYLSWNRTRWEALNYLTQVQKVSPANIDGGFEFNGFHMYNSAYIASVGRSWWWVIGDDYMITFGIIPKYKIEKKYKFKKWLPPGNGNILILKKTN